MKMASGHCACMRAQIGLNLIIEDSSCGSCKFCFYAYNHKIQPPSMGFASSMAALAGSQGCQTLPWIKFVSWTYLKS